MSTTVEIVYYTPRPHTGERFAVAALLTDSKGKRRLVEPARQRGAGCLGSEDAQRFLSRVLDAMKASPGELPPQAGRLLSFGDAMGLDVDPVEWLERSVFPVAQKSSKQRLRRARLGSLWLEAENVQARVCTNFKPKGKLFSPGIAKLGLSRLSLFAPAGKFCLFVEPLDPERADFQRDVDEVAGRFRGYRDFFVHAAGYELHSVDELIEMAARHAELTPTEGLLQTSPLIRHASFAAVVLPGGTEEIRKYSRDLGQVCQLQADVNNDMEREYFVERLNLLGDVQAAM